MVNTSESLIKTIADLRRKIHVTKQKLEKKADVSFTIQILFLSLFRI